MSRKRILIVDNFDSFTYNLYHYLAQCDVEKVGVVRNNHDLCKLAPTYDAILLSPGPGLPHEAGNMPELIQRYSTQMPFLGVCLGHQALANHFGAELRNMTEVMHGRESQLQNLDVEDVIFNGLNLPVVVGRYHSWVVSKTNFPSHLKITSEDGNGLIMSFTHQSLPICGVQFHPESVMSNQGLQMIRNWVDSI